MATVVPVVAVTAAEMTTYALSPEERLLLFNGDEEGDRLDFDEEGAARVGGVGSAKWSKPPPLFQHPELAMGTSWIVPVELQRLRESGTIHFKTIYMKVDTGADLSGVTPEGAEMISTYKCEGDITGSASFVRGIGHKTVAVKQAIFPEVCFWRVGSGLRQRQTLQVVVMEGATDRSHQILLGSDNLVKLGFMPRYENGKVVGVSWQAIKCYSEVCTPESAARQFSW